MTALSILDLVRVTEDTDARVALNNARDIAVHAEAWGYRRIWVAEHHNMPGIASAATSVVIGHIAAGTKTIRVGAGGIMLPNHAPYVIAEQFGTLARLFPGRIDLGLGRAPGTDQLTLRALRRTPEAAENFPQDVLEVQAFLAPAGPNQRIRAVPAAGTEVPLVDSWDRVISARCWRPNSGFPMPSPRISRPNCSSRRCRSTAAASNLPSSLTVPMRWWASTSSPPAAMTRRAGWRRRSRCPSRTSSAARAALASRRSTTLKATGRLRKRAQAMSMLARSIVGSPDTVRSGIDALIAETGADELMIVSDVYDHATRLRSFELIASAARIAT